MVKRDERIDNLRALAILLVVFGHSIILYSSSWDLYETEVWAGSFLCSFFDVIKNWINLIQMPLFFSISGFLFLEDKEIKSLITSKAMRLLVPYVCIGAFWMIPVKCLVGYSPYAGRNYFQILLSFLLRGDEQGHLWFLPCLFLCFLFGRFWNGWVVGKLAAKKKLAAASLLTLCMVMLLRISSRIISIGLYMSFTQWFFYFEVGYFLKKLDLADKLRNRRVLLVVGAVLLSVLSLRTHLPIREISSLVLLLTFYAVIPEKINKLSGLLSSQSFGIYLFHSPLIYITYAFWREWNPLAVVAVNFLVFGLLSLLLSLGIQKTRLRFMIGQH